MISRPTRNSQRSLGQWLVILFFGLLSLAFFLRLLQVGYRWIVGPTPTDMNYKVATILLLVYTAFTAGIAAMAWKIGRGETEDDLPR